MTATDHQSVTKTPRAHQVVSPTVKATGQLFAGGASASPPSTPGSWPPEPYPTTSSATTPPC